MAGEQDGADGAIPANIIKLAEAQQKKAQKGAEEETVAQALVRLGSQAELFHDETDTPYTSVIVNGHRETWHIRSTAARGYLSRAYNKECGRVPGGQALQDALNVLCGRAVIEGAERETHVRVARGGTAIYLDLAGAERAIVEISGGTWKVVQDAPVRFRRPPGLTGLPNPVRGGSLDELRQFINVSTERDWLLVVGWLVHTFFEGPYPWLLLTAKQGTGKSFTSRILRTVIDPNKASTRAPPKTIRDLAISAANSAVLAFDNVSFIDAEQSDGVCRLATGGGFTTRMLRTDVDEVIIDVMRPGILNGITDIASRGDLLERMVPLDLKPLTKEQRKPERELLKSFEGAHPRILGALLDLVARSAELLPEVHLYHPPRMVDFACTGIAVEQVLGLQPGSFMAAYDLAITAATDVAVDVSVIFPYILKIAELGGFTGTADELLTRLNELFDGTWPTSPHDGQKTFTRRQRPQGWPRSSHSLSGQLRRLEDALHAKGIGYRREQTSGTGSKKLIIIEGLVPPASEASQIAPAIPAPTGPTFFSLPATPAASPAAADDGSSADADPDGGYFEDEP